MSKDSYDEGVEQFDKGLPLNNPYGDTEKGWSFVEGYEGAKVSAQNNRDKTCIVDMNAAMRFINTFLREHKQSPLDVHLTCCQETAERFSLWDDEQMFPTWLSRIIAGAMSDIAESDPSAFPYR